MNKKKIFSLTTSRADYGLLRQLYIKINQSKFFTLNVLVSGMHLIKSYGYSINEVKKDNFNLKILKNKNTKSNEESILKSISEDIINFTKIFIKERPDFFIVLGDRYEIIGSVISCHFLKIPVIHLHGGEKTEASYDDVNRHVITKYSTYHFVSHLNYKKRVIQLGENPKNIFITGPLAIDSIKNSDVLNKQFIEEYYKFKFKEKNILITYHPITNDIKRTKKELYELISFLKKLKDFQIIFTFPNLDLFSKIIINEINKFEKNNKNCLLIKTMGQQLYFSTLRHVDCVIGNSSSGIIEVPFFKIPTINIGDRQKGRIKPLSVIDSNYDQKSIEKSFKRAYSIKFLDQIKKSQSIYNKVDVSEKMIKNLIKISSKIDHSKSFYDLKNSNK